MADVRISRGRGTPKMRAVAKSQWTRAKRAAFLDHLAMTCNVLASVRFVGMSSAGLYQLRQRDKEFAGLWVAALRAGYDRLEERLLQHAGAGYLAAQVNDVPMGETEFVEQPLNVELAFDLLKRHRVTIEGGRRPIYGKYHRANREEAEKKLLAKLDGLAKRLRAEQRALAEAKGESPGE